MILLSTSLNSIQLYFASPYYSNFGKDISMKKKSHLHEKSQQHSIQLTKEANLNQSQPIRMVKPLPQIYSYHHMPTSHAPLYLKTEHYPKSIADIHQGDYQNTTSNYRQNRSKVRKHGQYITQECIPLLKERLKSIHDYYDALIAEEKNRNSEKSEIILEVIDEMQAIHADKVNEMKRLILESEEQKRDVGFVDDKMNEIKGNIEELIEQSNTLKVKNGELQSKIDKKRKDVKDKQYELEEMDRQLLEARGELQSFQINNLKNNKINRDILEIFNSASGLAQNN